MVRHAGQRAVTTATTMVAGATSNSSAGTGRRPGLGAKIARDDPPRHPSGGDADGQADKKHDEGDHDRHPDDDAADLSVGEADGTHGARKSRRWRRTLVMMR